MNDKYQTKIDGANLSLKELENLAAEIRTIITQNEGLSLPDYIERASKINYMKLGYRRAKAFIYEPKLESFFPDEVYSVLRNRFSLIKEFHTNKEDEMFLRRHSLKGLAWMAQKMYTTPKALSKICIRLGIKPRIRLYSYTPETLEFIKKYAHKGATWISNALHISTEAIQYKAKSMGINLVDPRFYTKEEDKFVIDNCIKGSKYLSNHLGRPLDSIRKRARILNLDVPFVHSGRIFHKFTKQEDDFIKSNAHMGSVWIAKNLNLQASSIQEHAKNKKIKLARIVMKYTSEDNQFIKNNVNKGSEYIANHFGVSKEAIERKIFRVKEEVNV